MVVLRGCDPPKNLDEYRDVFVYVQHKNGKIERGSLEMLGMGRELADKLEEKLVGIMVGSDLEKVADEAANYNCDTVIGIESPDLKTFSSVPFSHFISETVESYKPNIFLMSGTREGRDLVSRIAIRCNTGVAADCIELDADKQNRLLIAWRPSFGDNTIDQILCRKHRPQMITSRPGSYKLPGKNRRKDVKIDIRKVKVPDKMKTVKVLEFRPRQALDLTTAKTVVSGGLGLGKPDGFKYVDDLAKELGGVVGASRPVVDLGWIPYDHQVGQTGRTVRPHLYVAAGISGKIQHLVGMKDSEFIVSINTDPDAEIVKYSDFYVHGNLYDALPKLTEEIRKRKSGTKNKV